MTLNEVTLIVPYYRNPQMLAEQVGAWNTYPRGFQFIVVDDGSPEPAEPIVVNGASTSLLERLSLYRIDVDIPWNRGGARNLGTFQAETKWIIHVDIDHLFPTESANALLRADVDDDRWYRFRRYRNGKADATRKKDKIPPDQLFGEIHPHVDSYLCTRDLYIKVGGYDEDYSGCLGGGNPFLSFMSQAAPVLMMPNDVVLYVYTRDRIADASDLHLPRSSAEYTKRKREKQKAGKDKPINPLRFPWTRIL